MERGHRGANHPVKDLMTGQIEITSQNHGFMVDEDSLPDHLRSHIVRYLMGLLKVCVIRKPMFCVQYHPESSPGPHDSTHLFKALPSDDRCQIWQRGANHAAQDDINSIMIIGAGPILLGRHVSLTIQERKLLKHSKKRAIVSFWWTQIQPQLWQTLWWQMPLM